MLIIVALVAFVCLGAGLWAGFIGGRLLLPADRHRLDVLVRQLMAEQQIDNHTRATLQAMRDATRRR